MRKTHYSGKVVQNSQLHIGVFFKGKLEGALQFGPSLDKRKLIGLVEGTKWNSFIELNRLAFTDELPRNSESRAIAVAMHLMRKHAPHVKWIVSYADATRCGDGTIYRASGFILTGIKQNQQLYTLPFADELETERLLSEGWSITETNWTKRWLDEITPRRGNESTYALRPVAHKLTVEDRPVSHKISLEGHPHAHKMSLEGGHRPSQALSQVKRIMRRLTNGATSAHRFFVDIGGQITPGFQLRYIFFVDKSWRAKLTVPEIPYSKIKEIGAGMYKGIKYAGS